jgi:hypothetical protein
MAQIDDRLPYRCSSWTCPDGIVRSDCVVVVDDGNLHAMGDEARCGKPMVGVVPFVMGSWMRMCEDCFKLFTHDFEERLGVRL